MTSPDIFGSIPTFLTSFTSPETMAQWIKHSHVTQKAGDRTQLSANVDLQYGTRFEIICVFQRINVVLKKEKSLPRHLLKKCSGKNVESDIRKSNHNYRFGMLFYFQGISLGQNLWKEGESYTADLKLWPKASFVHVSHAKYFSRNDCFVNFEHNTIMAQNYST